MAEHQRDPCPYRIVDDLGGAYCMGAVGGSIWHAVKGAKNAPKGWGNRFRGALAASKARAPVVGGSFAIWGGMFASFDCTLAYVRQKEDSWNAIASGALTGGVLAIRSGPKAAMRNAIAGGVILALIEGVGLWISRGLLPMLEKQQLQQPAGGAQEIPLTPPGFGGGFGGLLQSPPPAREQESIDQFMAPIPPPEEHGFDVDSSLHAPAGSFDSNAGDPYASSRSASSSSSSSKSSSSSWWGWGSR